MPSSEAGNPESAAPAGLPPMPLKQKMAVGFASLLQSAKKLAIGHDATARHQSGPAPMNELFPKVDPAIDGADCLLDCDSCTVHYPRNFKIDEDDVLYGHVKAWSTHVVVATCKSDWVRDVADEKGSVMEALGRAAKPGNGRLMVSASNMPTPHNTTDYSEPTTVLLLPAFLVISNVTPSSVPALVDSYVNAAPTATSPLAPLHLPRSLLPLNDEGSTLLARPSPHAALILLCSQKTRDARCGQSAPLLRKELERQLRPLGLYRDLDDERPGGVGIYFISHVGGHKYSANVMVYRRRNAFGVDGVAAGGDELRPRPRPRPKEKTGRKTKPEAVARQQNGQDAQDRSGKEEDRVVVEGDEGKEDGEAEADHDTGGADEDEDEDVGAAQCIWLARIRPEDCEGLVKFTVLQGKVVKPERQLRGGYDRAKGLLSW